MKKSNAARPGYLRHTEGVLQQTTGELERVKQQRDGLLAALKRYDALLPQLYKLTYADSDLFISLAVADTRATAAIAKAS